MTKQEKFLWLVQTLILTNCNHLEISYMFMLIHRALEASERIPEDLSYNDAANEFSYFFIEDEGDFPDWCEGI